MTDNNSNSNVFESEPEPGERIVYLGSDDDSGNDRNDSGNIDNINDRCSREPCACAQNAARPIEIVTSARRALIAGQRTQTSVTGLGPTIPHTCPHSNSPQRTVWVRGVLRSTALGDSDPITVNAGVRGGVVWPLVWDVRLANARTAKDHVVHLEVYDESSLTASDAITAGTVEPVWKTEMVWHVHPTPSFVYRKTHEFFENRESKRSAQLSRALFDGTGVDRDWRPFSEIVQESGSRPETVASTLTDWLNRGIARGRWRESYDLSKTPEREFQLTDLGVVVFGPQFPVFPGDDDWMLLL